MSPSGVCRHCGDVLPTRSAQEERERGERCDRCWHRMVYNMRVAQEAFETWLAFQALGE
jgi:DNA-directed RNA polymerase subunit RPC12/RpoP